MGQIFGFPSNFQLISCKMVMIALGTTIYSAEVELNTSKKQCELRSFLCGRISILFPPAL